MLDLQQLSGGNHVVLLDESVAPGHWLRLDLDVETPSRALVTFTVWLAHLTFDIKQDGHTNISDVSGFGDEWLAERRIPLLDVNGDGAVTIGDVTAFGEVWQAGWANTRLPSRP